jgi:hypothetical protein
MQHDDLVVVRLCQLGGQVDRLLAFSACGDPSTASTTVPNMELTAD